jgi:low temperature requirement protein LtrA
VTVPRSRHLRRRDGREQKTTALELFFDLVYVFAVTQLSHLVIDGGISGTSLVHAGFLLLVVWWAWIYTTWWVNWYDPDSGAVRLVLAAVALGSLLMSAAIPSAFDRHGLLFAGAYVAMQVSRNVAAVVLAGPGNPLRLVFGRIVVWSLASGALWLAGGFATGHARFALWAVALAVDLVAPLFGYRTPGLGSSATLDWDVEGGHFAERFQSFVIIALGESIVVTGATASARGLTGEIVLALSLAFVVTATMWWLYFGEVAEGARRTMAESEDPGRLARDAYTYLHLPIVTGIIMVAIGDELLFAHPRRPLSTAGLVMTVAGPAVYLLGESLVRLRMIRQVGWKRLVAVGAFAVLGVAAHDASAVVVCGGVAAVLVLLAAWEYPPVRPDPSPAVHEFG